MSKKYWISVSALILAIIFTGGYFMFGNPFSKYTPSGLAADVKMEEIRAERPEFKREYSAKLSNGRSMKITAESLYTGRYYYGELDQPGGAWILFEPSDIADKIIDPQLYPLVKKYTDEIVAMDGAYVASKPSQFTDEDGTVWQRQN